MFAKTDPACTPLIAAPLAELSKDSRSWLEKRLRALISKRWDLVLTIVDITFFCR
jgi:hypothetical protein